MLYYPVMGPALLKSVIDELGALLTGGIISKIHQPDDKEVCLKVFARGADMRLLISAHHKFARLHLTKQEFENPPTPLRFCAFLRSRMTNARITGIMAEQGQRIARISLSKQADGAEPLQGADEQFTLIAELTGKSANIILTDKDGIILDSLKYFPPEASQRVVMPGLKLAPLAPRPAPFEEEPILKEAGVTWNMAADLHYGRLSDEEAAGLERNRLRRAINAAAKRLKQKAANLEKDRQHALDNLGAEKLGQIVAQNLGRIRRGDALVKLTDYSSGTPEQRDIPLDPKLGPKENLEKFFKRSKKAKAALALLRDRLPQTARELEYINELEYELEGAAAPEELRTLEDELISEGYLKKSLDAGHRTKPDEERAEPVRRVTSSDGFEILCGKSAIGNDIIVKRYASDADIWFHAEGVPGSHVLIKTAGRAKDITKKTIEEAAALAAWHSKAQTASKTAVVYTEARNVRKPRGAKPGMVTLKEYKTIVVKPKAME